MFCSSKLYSLKRSAFLGNFSYVPSSVFSFQSYSLQKKQYVCSSLSGSTANCSINPCLVIRNQFMRCSSGGSCSTWNFESNSLCKKQAFYYFSSRHPPTICPSTHSLFHSLLLPRVLELSGWNRCLSSGCFHGGSMPRYFTALSSNQMVTYPPNVEGEGQSVANVCTHQQMLEKKNHFPHKYVLEIVDIIMNNKKDLEHKLSMQASRLSIYSVTEIFEILNSQRVSGLGFFQWIWTNSPRLCKNARICSLVIDNSGRLEDYETMSVLLNKFTSEKICLTYDAFGFLPVLGSTNSSPQESTKRVVDLLNKVGGSCQNSGICALVELFCKLDLFEMARYVIQITECKESYYCLLIREKCRKCLIEDARGVIREMREANCAPTVRVYNYVLGSLYKNGKMDEASKQLDEMREIGILPDAITFEVLINSFCRLGKMNDVHCLLDQMVSQGIEPRLETHVSIVKALFASKNYEMAQKYVVDSSINFKTSSNTTHSLLASLYREKGDIMSARDTLVEMMDKSLKPDFYIYIKIVKQLKRSGRKNLARDLEGRFSKFVSNSCARQL